MEWNVDDFGLNFENFLSDLAKYEENVNRVDQPIHKLLTKCLFTVSALLQHEPCVPSIHDKTPQFKFNSEVFNIKRIAECRYCQISFPLTRVQYDEHLQSPQHIFESNKHDSVGAPHSVNRPPGVTRTQRLKQILDSSEMPRVCDLKIFGAENESTPNRGASTQAATPKFVFEPTIKSVHNHFQSVRNPFNFGNTEAVREMKPAPSPLVQHIEMKPNNINSVESMVGSANEFVCLKALFEGDFIEALKCTIKKCNGFKYDQVHSEVTMDVENLLKTKFNSVKCHLMGSRINKTNIDQNAVLDICVDLDDFYQSVAQKTIFKNVVEAQSLMNANKGEWSNAGIQTLSGVCWLTATHTSTGISCKFTFGNGIFLRNNDIVNAYFEAQPICRQLVLAIRLSMDHLKQSNWTRKFSGHIISLLVIFYLQTQNKLPSIKKLQEHFDDQNYMICGDMVVSFGSPKKHVIACDDRLSKLLIGFFEFYSKFDFAKNIIGVYEGVAIEHSSIETGDEKILSKTVSRFKRLISNNAAAGFKRSVMSTQDLLLFKRNATQSIDEQTINTFVKYCDRTLTILQGLKRPVRY